MKLTTVLTAVLGMGAVTMLASGEPTIAPSNATPLMMVSQDQMPTTQPVAPLPAPVVLIAPFQQVGNSSAYAWVGQALQQDLLASVARTGCQAKSTDRSIGGTDMQAAMQAGHDAEALYVISGSYQVVGDSLRVNAQVSDVAGNRIAGSLQATGEVRSLFSMEDSLAGQLKPILPQMLTSTLPTVTQGAQGSPYSYLAPPSTTSPNSGLYPTYAVPVQPSPDYSYDSSQYPYYSYPPPVEYGPYYDYSYPYGFGGFGAVVIVPGFHHFDHERFIDRRHFGFGFGHGFNVGVSPRFGARGERGR